MTDLERFEIHLAALLTTYNIDALAYMPDYELARKVIEYLEIVRACHADARELEINLVTRPHPVSLETVETVRIEPLLPDTGATQARHRTVHIGQREVPEPAKIEVLSATEDWCACGWSDEPHERSEHAPVIPVTKRDDGVPLRVEPTELHMVDEDGRTYRWEDPAPTPPHAACDRFVSEPGAFAVAPDSSCATCGASARAHGITMIGPPTQIAETLTPLED